MIRYEIFGSGSKGNAVLIEGNILIDIGVPFRALTDHYRQIQLVLLTHKHGDHFNRQTIRRLALERPALRWGVPEWLVAGAVAAGVGKENIDVLKPGSMYNYSLAVIEPVSLCHDVPNCGYKIRPCSGGRLFYATDTASLAGISANAYDLYMVEANYGEDEIAGRISRKLAAGEYCYEFDARERHLSREQADDWLYANMGPESVYVYMHEHD